MSDYYDFLENIVDRKDHLDNYHIVVKGKIPFRRAHDAIQFLTDTFPDVTPMDGALVQDKQMCQTISQFSFYELIYLEHQMDDLIRAADANLQTLQREEAELEKKEQNIETTAALQTVRNHIIQAAGCRMGLSSAATLLHSRKFELLRLTDQPYDPEWRL